MDVYAKSRKVDNKSDCFFYHTMDLPGYGLCEGVWDLREKVDEYLGFVDVKGKRVLEIGTASGYVCFEREKRNADVVAFDLDENATPDSFVPPGYDYDRYLSEFRVSLRELNNSYWLAYGAYQSQAKMVYGNAYNLPDELGCFDIVTLGSVLLHLRDPFLALQNAAKHSSDRIIVTEILYRRFMFAEIARKIVFTKIARKIVGPDMPAVFFAPDPGQKEPQVTWWVFTPNIFTRMLDLLGFRTESLHYHTQLYKKKKSRLFTLVVRKK